jgi:hypothetical protein
MADPAFEEITAANGELSYNPYGFRPFHGQVQMVMGVWDEQRGWLTTRRSMIYGGRHGEPPMIERDDAVSIIESEAGNGFRAMQTSWRKP